MAILTFCVRVLEDLMLFDVVKLSDANVTPHGAVLYSTIVSEICVGLPFTVLALVAALMLYLHPQDTQAQVISWIARTSLQLFKL